MLTVNQRGLIRRMVLGDGISQRKVARQLDHSRNSDPHAVCDQQSRAVSSDNGSKVELHAVANALEVLDIDAGNHDDLNSSESASYHIRPSLVWRP